MNEITARRLVALNNEFYRKAAGTFSITRQHSWPGWETVADCVRNDLLSTCTDCGELPADSHVLDGSKPLDVLDLACGNQRFAAYLENACPDLSFRFHAVDNCELFEHVDVRSPLDFQLFDVLESLMAGTLGGDLHAPLCQIAACFAFIHHIPSFDLRVQLLHELVARTRPGGLTIVSLWSFMDEPGLATRAAESTQQAIEELQFDDLEENDCLLGWQNTPGLWRYCHSFDDEEVADLADSVERDARLIRRYRADGRNGKLNSYLVFQRD